MLVDDGADVFRCRHGGQGFTDFQVGLPIKVKDNKILIQFTMYPLRF
jgi:hypothetical protein